MSVILGRDNEGTVFCPDCVEPVYFCYTFQDGKWVLEMILCATHGLLWRYREC